MRAGVALPPLLMPASPTLVAVGLKRALSLSPDRSSRGLELGRVSLAL
jgi:hypothetical protein